MSTNCDHQGIGADSRNTMILLRPPHVLQELPLEYRWEFTRRHPYYLSFWSGAHVYHARLFSNPEEERCTRVLSAVLAGIGVSSDPPPPTTSAAEFGATSLSAAWREGAVAPLTYRSFAALLMSDLPSSAKRAVANFLLESAAIEEGGCPDDVAAGRFDQLLRLLIVHEPALDAAPARPILGVNPYAPERALREALDELLPEWKRQLNIPERRRRHDRLKDYLDVWDLREGWSGSGYVVGDEQEFQAIATRLRVPITTVVTRYHSAFRLIGGHDYCLENWVRLFYIIKLCTEFGVEALSRRSVMGGLRRREAIRQVRETDLTRGEPNSHAAFAVGEAPALEGLCGNALVWDILECLKRGWTDERIDQELSPENPGRLIGAIAYLRKHGAP